MDAQKNTVFKFTDPRQERVYAKLLEIGPGPAAFFKDACRMWENDPPLESQTNIIAHCLREIQGSVIDVMLPLDFKASSESENNKTSQKEKIKTILGIYSIDPEHELAKLWLRIADSEEEIAIYQFVHRNALDRSKEVDSTFEELWNGMQGLLDILLNRLEANYLGFFKILDDLLTKKDISAADIQTLKTKIPNSPVTYSYFFEKLENPAWLELLKEAGFFKHPPLPILHPDSGTSFPYWPQAQYLRKMAKINEQQETVLAICLDIKTENIRSRGEILDIALLLPADMSVKIVDSIGEIDSWFSPEKYGKLISYLAKEGKKDKALALAKKILEIQPDPRKPAEYGGTVIPHDPIGLIRDWDYQQILEKDFTTLIDATGLEAIKILLDQIETYIKLASSDKESKSKDDYSEIWRSAIEDHSRNHDHNIRDLLVNGARDACEQFLKNHPDQIEKLTTELEDRKLLIFKRLELHLLRLFSKGVEKKITQLLVNQDEFESHRLLHEYFLLAEAHSSLLSQEQRGQIWSWIVKGPNVEEYKTWRKQNGVEPSDEEIQKYQKNWQMYHLMPFKKIDPKWQKYFEELVAVVGEPDHPSFRSWSEGGSWGPTSAVSTEELKKMQPDEIIKYLKGWEPKSDGPSDNSREGIGRELTALVTEDPEKLSNELTTFGELDPTYVRSVLTGYRDAIRQDKKFNWTPILNLSEIVLSKPIKITDRKSSSFFGDDPDWSWCRNTIVELVEEGFEEKEGKIPMELREKVWPIIEALTGDSDPTPEREKESLTNRDLLSVAINSTRGDAMGAAMKYGIWLKNSLNKELQSKWSLKENAPELLKVLNDHLDITKDPSLGIRALYGEKLGTLTWLDEEWVQKNQNLIFPEEPGLQEFFDAAWETYITFSLPFDQMFKLINKQYQRAVNEIGKHTDGKHYMESPEQNLVQHLIIFYCRGLLELDDSLLLEFYKKASLELKAEVIEFIGRVCKNDKEMPQKIRDRFIKLLEERIAEVKGGGKSDEIQEFKGFSWWVASEKFEDEWVLEKLSEILELGCDLEGAHLIIERFNEIATRFPVGVINCSQLMVENDKKGWGVLTWAEDLKSILKTVLESANEEAIKLAVEFIHRLTAKGNMQFKELLESNPAS